MADALADAFVRTTSVSRICKVVRAIDDFRLKRCLLLQVMIFTLFLRVSCCKSVCVTGIPRVKVSSPVCCDIG